MTSIEILRSDFLDILFENRNKQYGAYALRRQYTRHVLIALIVAIGSVLIPLSFLGGKDKKMIPENKPDVLLSTVVLPPDPEVAAPIPPATRPVEPPQVAEASFSRLQMVEQPRPENEMLTINELQDRRIGSLNLDGPEISDYRNDLPPFIGPAAGSGSGKGNEEDEPQGFTAVEIQPEFPGGTRAWLAFLEKHLRAPSTLEAGERKVVMISFNVAADGSVSDLQVAQSAGKAFDEEVLRVMKKMPKWRPAVQNGRPVPVPFRQPVVFVGFE